MKIIDITVPISENTPVFPGDPHPIITSHKSHLLYENGVVVSELKLTTHSGTHIDAPAHVEPNGLCMDSFPVELVEGRACVVDMSWITHFESVASLPKEIRMQDCNLKMLIFASNSNFSVFPNMKPRLIDYLKQSGVEIIATDLLSIDAVNDKSLHNHRLILGSNIWIAENLDLSDVENGFYRYIIAPMKTSAIDGAPARAILIKD